MSEKINNTINSTNDYVEEIEEKEYIYIQHKEDGSIVEVQGNNIEQLILDCNKILEDSVLHIVTIGKLIFVTGDECVSLTEIDCKNKSFIVYGTEY